MSPARPGRKADASKSVIENFVPLGGSHCITNALRQIFAYHGHLLSEEMIFGLASGLSFLYLNQSSAPLISGRTKVGEFEAKLAQRLQITIRCRGGKDGARAQTAAKRMIDAQEPVLVYADMAYLPYLGMPSNSHFGGHAVVLFGYDDAARQFWLSDRDNHDHPIVVPDGQLAQDSHLIAYEDLARARGSVHRPFPAHNRFLTFDFSAYQAPGPAAVRQAVREACAAMLTPPAQLLGCNGILKFSKEILKWRQFDPEKLERACTANYFQIHENGGTGGGIFRRLYGGFLLEAAAILQEEKVEALGVGLIAVSERWDDIAQGLRQLAARGDDVLFKELSAAITQIYRQEKNLYALLRDAIG